ncbi:MAG: right-handed parallel beta-helix repeat-containing protein, partial [Gorillibacterium sp.]|nr:right-handed parallel beta-helix repeat-containing protein [Gorillibacterium sp.]
FCYELDREGRLFWLGEGWRFREGPMQTFDPVSNTTWRMDNWVERALRIEELEPMQLRLYFDFTPMVKVGNVLQTRDGIRDQVGVFIVESIDIRFSSCGMHFMHGLGMVGQYSENLTFEQMDLSPRAETGRTAAGFADLIHLSGCSGKVRISDNRFIGAHDDAINVHGTYLRIIDRPETHSVRVRFMHPQTYGFPAFYPGDEIDFVRAASLTTFGSNRVESAEWINPREILLKLAHPVPDELKAGDVVENVTWTPEVEIVNNYFARIPTRGVLVTTMRKVVIADNVFERMHMSGISIGAEAISWHESGRVQDVTICGNQFIECGSNEHPVIYISPENTDINVSAPIHRGIHIENNRIETRNAQVLSAKSTRGLIFKKNEIIVLDGNAGFNSLDKAIHLIACSEVEIADNTFSTERLLAGKEG